MEDRPNAARPRVAVTAALLLLLASLPVLLLSSTETLFEPLTLVLAAGAVVSVLYASGWEGIDDIPEIARIVAVAEVYDTLTAEDTYRDRMTPFQAMTELRRVAGRQLDARFVEALAELLAGRGLEYRHADTADFDTELAIEGRIADSVATDSAAGSGSTSALAAKPTAH